MNLINVGSILTNPFQSVSFGIYSIRLCLMNTIPPLMTTKLVCKVLSGFVRSFTDKASLWVVFQVD